MVITFGHQIFNVAKKSLIYIMKAQSTKQYTKKAFGKKKNQAFWPENSCSLPEYSSGLAWTLLVFAWMWPLEKSVGGGGGCSLCAAQSVLIERVATLGSKVTQKSSTWIVDHERVPKNSSNSFLENWAKNVESKKKVSESPSNLCKFKRSAEFRVQST